MTDRTFVPGPPPDTVRSPDGRVLTAPVGWVLLPTGDAALTRRVIMAAEAPFRHGQAQSPFTEAGFLIGSSLDAARYDLPTCRFSGATGLRSARLHGRLCDGA
jgi:hypothetical protein